MEILNQFGINPLLLAAQVVNFAILLFILKRFLYKPILRVLEERKKRIAESLKNAEEIEKKLLQTEEDREKKLVKASEEAQKIIDEGKLSVAQMMEEGRQKTAAEIESMLKKGEESLRMEREKMQQEIKGELANIVELALGKITGKTLTKADQKELIEREVKNLS